MLGVIFRQIQKRALAAPLRRKNLHLVSRALAQQFSQQRVILEVNGHVNHLRQVLGVKIKLFQKRWHKFVWIELLQVFPVKFAAVHHAPRTQVKKIRRNQGRLSVISQHIRIVALRRRNPLPLLNIVQRAQQVAVRSRLLKTLAFRRGQHALLDALHQVLPPAFQKHPRVAHRLRIAGIRG